MTLKLINRIHTFLKGVFRDEIIDNNTLNPVHLAIAARGYWIQSHILHISDGWGFFSPGPPRLQVAQGFRFALVVVFYSFAWLAVGIPGVLLFKCLGEPVTDAIVIMLLLTFLSVGAIWGLRLISPQRSPNFHWDDWKTHEE